MANSAFRVKKNLELVASDSGGELGIIVQDDGAGNVNRIWHNTRNGTFLGDSAGNLAAGAAAINNVVVGADAMDAVTTGDQNTAIGDAAAGGLTQGADGVFVGYQSGLTLTTGGQNVILGVQAGSAMGANVSGCVLLGHQAGQNVATGNRLYIDNSNTANPLIYGEFDNDFLKVNGDCQITGDLTVDGTTTTIHSETVHISDNHLYLNADYTTAVAQTGGLVVNYLPTATTDTVAAAGFTAGVAAVSNPTVATTGAATFALADIIQVSGATDPDNDGLYEVLSHAANLLTIRGIGLTGTVEDFTQNQFDTDAGAVGTIVKVAVSVIRSGTDGAWEVGLGSSTPLAFVDLAAGAGPWTEGPVGTIYPTTFATDDVIIGANATAGTERLRVAGDVLIDTNSTLTVANSATIPPLNLTERAAAPTAPGVGDIYLDDGTNYGGGSGNPGFMRCVSTGPSVWEDIGDNGLVASPWSEAAGVIYPTTHATDDVVIGTNAMSGTERFRVFNSVAVPGVSALIQAQVTGGSPGVVAALDVEVQVTGGTPTIVSALDVSFDPNGGTASFGYGMRVGMAGAGGGNVTTMYGIEISDLSSSGSTVTAYGIYINDQNPTGTGYGIYQAGNDDLNVFLGDIVIGTTAMSGTEKLRVSGSVLVDANGALTIADSATVPPLHLTQRNAAPTGVAAGDIYLDDGTNWGTGGGMPGFRRLVSTGPDVWEDIAFDGSSSDIAETTFAMANNVAVAANVTGLAFADATVRSFHALVSVAIDATADLFETFILYGVNRGLAGGVGWSMTVTAAGQDSDIDFTITNAGQVQYTSGNEAGWASNSCHFRAITTAI
jgi:hypothetical protein